MRVTAPEAREGVGAEVFGRGKTRCPLACFWSAGSCPTAPYLAQPSMELPSALSRPSPPHQGPGTPQQRACLPSSPTLCAPSFIHSDLALNMLPASRPVPIPHRQATRRARVSCRLLSECVPVPIPARLEVTFCEQCDTAHTSIPRLGRPACFPLSPRTSLGLTGRRRPEICGHSSHSGLSSSPLTSGPCTRTAPLMQTGLSEQDTVTVQGRPPRPPRLTPE